MVRLGELADLPAIADMGAHGCELARLPGKFNRKVWTAFWLNVLETKQGFIMVNQNEDGRLSGAMGGLIFVEPQTGEVVCTTAFMVASKKVPGGALCVLTEFEQEAKRRGAGHVCLSATMHKRLGTVNVAFRRRDYRPVEVIYNKELK